MLSLAISVTWVGPPALLLDLHDRGTLRCVRLCLSAPPSAFADCILAHISVNYPVVAARYRRAFCVILRLSSLC